MVSYIQYHVLKVLAQLKLHIFTEYGEFAINKVSEPIIGSCIKGVRDMEVMTTKQFAESQQVTYEAIRKQLIRYRKELDGHIIQKGRTKYLDEYAVEFLSHRRRENPVIMQTQDNRAEIEDLKQQIDNLRIALLESQQKVISLQESEKLAIESKAKYTALIEVHGQTENRLKETEQELAETKAQLRDAETEVSRYHKSIFGLYRRK